MPILLGDLFYLYDFISTDAAVLRKVARAAVVLVTDVNTWEDVGRKLWVSMKTPNNCHTESSNALFTCFCNYMYLYIVWNIHLVLYSKILITLKYGLFLSISN